MAMCDRCWRRPKTIGSLCGQCYAIAIRGLSSRAEALLVRGAAERFWLVLEASEVPTAMGLEKRGLVRTQRDRKGFMGRPEPGSRRTMYVTGGGKRYVDDMDAAKRERYLAAKPDPVKIDEAVQIARELARTVLDPKHDAQWLKNRARCALDRLSGVEG